MVEATSQQAEARWSGGMSPVSMSWNKLMMWIFIITDGLLFAGFLASYGLARTYSASWPDRLDVFQLWYLTSMTFVLISSSATMATGVGAAREGHMKTAAKMVGATLVGGLVFLGMQAWEWATLIHEGARMSSNPWGVPQFGQYFFLITGFHGTHVLTGVIVLTVLALRSLAGKSTPEGVEVAGLYWHFVDLVWVFIFTLFYLI